MQTNRDALNAAAAQGVAAVQAQAETFVRSLVAAQVNDYSISDQQFVTNLYEAFLQRGPDAGGLGFWTSIAANGNRQSVLNAFATCSGARELAGALYREAFWLVSDHLGTPRMIVDKSGSLASVRRHDYLPFGEELTTQGGRSPQLGYVGDNTRQQFTQKERDNETGLDYFLARYYSSTQGRFTSPDEFKGGPEELYTFADDAADNPTFYADITEPQSLNKYQYAYNNPLRYTDPNGHCPTCEVIDEVASSPEGQVVVNAAGAAITTVIVGASGAAKKAWDWLTTPGASVRGTQCMGRLDCSAYYIAQAREEAAKAQQNSSETAEKTKNVSDAEKKGVPKDQLGPSGKPKVHVVRHPTEKRAKDAARNQGQGAPTKDASPKKGGPHYHPTNRDGSRKKGKQNIHHEYPD